MRLRVALTAPGVVPTGRVVVRRGGTAVRGTWTLRDGVAEIVLRKQPRGRQRYAVRYAGDAGVAPLPLAVVRVRIP
ncbi:Ig-like domain-containing protein [Pimelobacter simplex]|uniref:Ig-like domain-containing protein n=1 Tax=Nocardioides simplex TaxID=2045 RepID=UPI00382884F9